MHAGGARPPLAGGGSLRGVLSGLLGGGGQAGGLGGLLGGGQPAAGAPGMGGGLGGLLSQFEQAGLGHVAQSWVGNGPNQPVSPQQLQSVFGEERVQSMASQAGMQPQDFLAQLSQHLPAAVDGMTPNAFAKPSWSFAVVSCSTSFSAAAWFLLADATP